MARIALNRPIDGHRVPNMSPEATEMGDTWDTVLAGLNTMFTELYSGASTITGNKTYSGTQTFNNTVVMQAGAVAAGTTFRPSGNLNTVVGPIGSSATNTTQTLASYVLPANVLDAAGRELQVTAWGTVAGNAAPKTLALNLGGAAVTTGTQTGSGYAWELAGTYQKQTANAQNAFFSGMASGGIITQKNATDSSVDTGTISLSCTMADASAAQSNVLLYGFQVQYFE